MASAAALLQKLQRVLYLLNRPELLTYVRERHVSSIYNEKRRRSIPVRF
jgi:hypothetical protein